MKMVMVMVAMAQAQPVPPIIMRPWPTVISPPRPPAPPPLPTMPSAPTAARRATPLGSLVRLFSGDDYPQAALRDNQQGAVGFALDISTDGRVARCTVTDSSGWPTLDAATCGIVQRRARFRPELDERGVPVVGRYMHRTRWEMDAIPFAPLARVTRIVTGPAGAVVSCTGSDDCWASEMPLDEMWRTLTGRAAPVTSEVVVERRFEPGEGALGTDARKASADGKIMFVGRARVTVGYNGKVSGCSAPSGGVGKANLCSLVEPWLFRLGPAKGETRRGVWSLSLRSRPIDATKQVGATTAQP